MSAFISPIGGAAAQFFTNQGVVLSGGLLYTYVAGTTTPQATWTDITQTVFNANPVVLDSAGRPPNEIWLDAALMYKFVLATNTGVILGTWDNISGVPSTLAGSLNQEWLSAGLLPTYISGSSFSVPGDARSTFTVNRRLRYSLASGTFYGYVSAVTYDGTSKTTVSVVGDTTMLDATLQAVSYGLLNAVNVSVPQQYVQQGQAINGSVIGNITPAAGTFTTLTSSNVNITGGTISGIAGFSVPDFLFKNNGVI